MENERLDAGDQPILPPQPPKHLTDDMLRDDVPHRLPPEPSALAIVSSIVLQTVAARRPRRGELPPPLPHGPPQHPTSPRSLLRRRPRLASIHPHHERCDESAGPAVGICRDHRSGFHGYGCTHGRMLLDAARDDNSHGELLVWDPLTEEHNLVPSAPGFVRGQSCGAALVCEANHAYHGDCHSSPFRVVFAYSEYMPPGPFHPPSSIRIFVYVYSSVTRSWGGRPAAVMRARARGGTSTGSRAPCPATATPCSG